LTIGDETRQWIDGEIMVFDTSIIHDAINESDQTRYILMMRIWHPDLTETERLALQHTYDCLNVPNLVSDNPELRFVAERQVEAMHAFPKIERKVSTASSSGGFGGGGGGGRNKKVKNKGWQKKTAKGFGNF
jgi:hypothetical protein